MPYIGRSSNFGVRTRFLYTATASQTTFSGTDTQNLTLSYSDSNFIDVHQNGVLLKVVDDYTATSGTSVVLATGATASDVIEITVYDVFSIANHIKKTGDAMAGALTNIDIDGTELVLDADGDTSITADTDDQIDIRIGGTDVATFTNSSSDFVITQAVQDKDIIFKGDDGGSAIEAARFDMSVGGFLGLGTTSPTSRLNISGDSFTKSTIRLIRTDNAEHNDAGLQFKSAAGANSGYGMGGIWFQNSLDDNAYALIRARTDDSTGTSGRLDFITSTDAVSNTTTPRMRIHSGGVVSFNNGIELGSALDATAANTLDDYEEGTWVPALTGPSSVSYSSQIGNYTKIGRMVFLSFSMTISSAPTGSSNYRMVIPFTPEGSSSREYGGDIFMDTALVTSNYGHFLGVYNGTTNVYVYTSAGSARSGSGAWQTGTLSGHIFINT